MTPSWPLCFGPDGTLLCVRARIFGPARDRGVLLAVSGTEFDTAIVPEILDEIGYGAGPGLASSVVRPRPGYTVAVARFSMLGFVAYDVPIRAQRLDDGVGVDGVVGLLFLRHVTPGPGARGPRPLAEYADAA